MMCHPSEYYSNLMQLNLGVSLRLEFKALGSTNYLGLYVNL